MKNTTLLILGVIVAPLFILLIIVEYSAAVIKTLFNEVL